MPQQLSNLASTTLNGAINSSVTSVSVTDGSVFPSSGDFYVIVDSEILLVTARSGNTLTVTRGSEGTTATSHSDLSFIKLTLTADTWDNWVGELCTIGARPTSPREGQIYYSSTVDAGWRFNGSTWDMIHPVYVPYARRVDVSGWTAFNHSTSTWVDTDGIMTAGLPGSTGDNLRGYYKNVPTAPYTATCIVRAMPQHLQYNCVGLTLSDTTKHRTTWVLSETTSRCTFSSDNYTTVTAFNGNNIRRGMFDGPYIWLRIVDDNTNWLSQYSKDGKNFTTLRSVARNSFLTPTKIGIVYNRVDNTYPSLVYNQFLAYWES